jgi:hypothetical protein
LRPPRSATELRHCPPAAALRLARAEVVAAAQQEGASGGLWDGDTSWGELPAAKAPRRRTVVYVSRRRAQTRRIGIAQEARLLARLVSQNGSLLSRRGLCLPASASGVDTHRDSITSRFDCSGPRWSCTRTWTSLCASPAMPPDLHPAAVPLSPPCQRAGGALRVHSRQRVLIHDHHSAVLSARRQRLIGSPCLGVCTHCGPIMCAGGGGWEQWAVLLGRGA